MALSLFLAKVLGLYFVVAGILLLVRRKTIMPVILEIPSNRPLLLTMGAVELVAGIALVIGHPYTGLNWQGLITFIGLWMIVEGVFYLALPMKKIKGIIRRFTHPIWYTGGGVLAVIIGAYLALTGFGIL